MLTSPTVVAAPRSRRRWLWLTPLLLVVVVLVVAVAAVVTLRVAFHGSALASRVCARLNADMRGRVAIASIEWPLASVTAVAGGGWVPVVLRDVQVRDADGVVVLRSPAIRAEIDVHAVLFGHHDVLARKVVMDGGELVVREVAEARPAFAGDTAVSLVAAFESRAAPRAGATRAAGGARLELRDAEVRGVRVVVHALPLDPSATEHEVHATIADVSTRGSLAYDPRVSPPRLVFDAAPRGGAGEVVARGQRLAIASVDVKELAQADTIIRFTAVVGVATGETVVLGGELHGYWSTGHFQPGSRLLAMISGVRRTLALTPPVELALPPLALSHDLHAGTGGFDLDARVPVAGGALTLKAGWGGGPDGTAPTWLRGSVTIAEPLDLTPWLGPGARRELGHTLRGSVAITVDAATDGRVRVGSPDLRLQKLRIDAGTVVIEDARHLRIEGLHYALPGLEGTYGCALDLGPPVEGSCQGRDRGDARVLTRLRALDTW